VLGLLARLHRAPFLVDRASACEVRARRLGLAWISQTTPL
jgi:hypothetical protein